MTLKTVFDTDDASETLGFSSYDPIVLVGCYTQFDNLAHLPRGTEARHPVQVFRLDSETGALTLIALWDENQEPVMNPAFFRVHPQRNVIYACTESIKEQGEVVAFKVDPKSGALALHGREFAGGLSTCFLSVDHLEKSMLLVNYWDSTMGVMPVMPDGAIAPLKTLTDPERKITKVDAFESRAAGKHDMNDASTQAQRQSEPHAHAIVLDPVFGRIAYVPDLGEDCVHQYLYDPVDGSLKHTARLACGIEGQGPHGPRYIEFHSEINCAYVVNELACTVAVFDFDVTAAHALATGRSKEAKTLTLVQSVSTVPRAYPTRLNTCSRVALHPSQRYVLVGNRGHDSIAVLKVHRSAKGKLSHVSFFHTQGKCPRHFQFDRSGQWLIAANQDTDEISVFSFNQSSGMLSFTGHKLNVPSPNFVCVHTPYVMEIGNEMTPKRQQQAAITMGKVSSDSDESAPQTITSKL